MDLPVMPPVKPMLARSAPAIPAGQLYEPKWDGFRAIVFRDGDEVEIGSRNERPLTRYFPEVVDAVRSALPPRCVVDGEIVIVEPGRGVLDFDALQLRLHPAASRVRLLAGQTPARFIAFDVLAVGDEDLTGMPFSARRARLEYELAEATPPVHLTPLTDDAALAAVWFETLEGAGLDGVVAKDPRGTYLPDKRVMTKVKHVRTVDCVVAGYRPHAGNPEAVGSLMLGLWQDDGRLASLGVIGAFPMARRVALVEHLAPYVTTFDGHPWDWAGHLGELTPSQQRGAGSRWNAGKSLSFIPLRPELVVEAKYDYLDGGRFRHTAQFVRWRPDRDAASCTFEQLDEPVPYDITALLGDGAR
ncbi:MAG: ATP-dependent DNA ligase [Lapillicoccus sp.]